MSFDLTPVHFMLEVIGDVSGHRWEGTFKVKPVLTHREQILRDVFMRDLLGTNPKDASIRAVSQAGILAEVKIRAVDAPSWWKDSNNGLDLLDENVIAEIYDKILDIDAKWKADVKSKAEKAKTDLAELDKK